MDRISIHSGTGIHFTGLLPNSDNFGGIASITPVDTDDPFKESNTEIFHPKNLCQELPLLEALSKNINLMFQKDSSPVDQISPALRPDFEEDYMCMISLANRSG